MRSTLLLFSLLGWVFLCQSCTFYPFNSQRTQCVDNSGAVYSADDYWVDGCYACACMSDGFSCCSTITGTTVDIPEGCMMLVDYVECEAELVSVLDPETPCSSG